MLRFPWESAALPEAKEQERDIQFESVRCNGQAEHNCLVRFHTFVFHYFCIELNERYSVNGILKLLFVFQILMFADFPI